MKFLNTEEVPPPPGIFSSIKAGFDITANKPSIMLLPVLLDLFLWLGPKLQINGLLRVLLRQIEIFAKEGTTPPADVQRVKETLDNLIALDVNLFGILRTVPIGVSSLLGKNASPHTPLGTPVAYQIESAFVFLLAVGVLLFIGWGLGSVYFAWVARVALKETEKLPKWFGRTVLQTVLLAVFLTIILLAFGFPMAIVFSLFVQINPTLAQIALFLFALFAMWLIVPVFFVAHGIFVKKENLFRSMLSSFHLSRFTLPTSSFFVISVIILSQGFNILWLTPSSGSWMLLLGIFGHAFITTALLAASFIYYRDMNAWLETLLEKLKSKKSSAQA
jgi:hypothetical protein